MKIIYEQYNTKIIESYKATDVEFEVIKIINYRIKNNLLCSRNANSYVREWKAHNRLYKLHLFRSHTKDVDLNENNLLIEELLWLLLGGF